MLDFKKRLGKQETRHMRSSSYSGDEFLSTGYPRFPGCNGTQCRVTMSIEDSNAVYGWIGSSLTRQQANPYSELTGRNTVVHAKNGFNTSSQGRCLSLWVSLFSLCHSLPRHSSRPSSKPCCFDFLIAFLTPHPEEHLPLLDSSVVSELT